MQQANNDWPRIYSTTMAQRLDMPQADLEALWQEYREFWRGYIDYDHHGLDKALDAEYQKDWLEDKDSTYR